MNNLHFSTDELIALRNNHLVIGSTDDRHIIERLLSGGAAPFDGTKFQTFNGGALYTTPKGETIIVTRREYETDVYEVSIQAVVSFNLRVTAISIMQDAGFSYDEVFMYLDGMKCGDGYIVHDENELAFVCRAHMVRYNTIIQFPALVWVDQENNGLKAMPGKEVYDRLRLG